MQIKSKAILGILSIGVIVLLAYVGLVYAKGQSEKRACQIYLRNYNQCLASFGMHASECQAVWKDPKLSEEFAYRKYGVKIPECPSGGSYSIVCNSPIYPISQLVCSLGHSHGHVDTNIEEQIEFIKRRHAQKAEQVAP